MILKMKLAQTLASLFGLDIIEPFRHYRAWFSLRHKHNGDQKTHTEHKHKLEGLLPYFRLYTTYHTVKQDGGLVLMLMCILMLAAARSHFVRSRERVSASRSSIIMHYYALFSFISGVSHDVTKIQTAKLLILRRFYFHDV